MAWLDDLLVALGRIGSKDAPASPIIHPSHEPRSSAQAQAPAALSDVPLRVQRERVSHIMGVGCLIQGLGLLSPFVCAWLFGIVGMMFGVGGGVMFGVVGGVLGVVLLVILFFVGSAQATSWRCGACKNPLASQDVTICPVCKASVT